MPHPAQAAPSPTSPNFAGLLAALASPAAGATDSAPASPEVWGSGDLGEDVATLSYERALRAHARYKAADRGDWPVAAAIAAQTGDVQGAAKTQAAEGGEGLPAQASVAPQAALDRDVRRASVTIRLSGAECALLRQRAAEAGVTVSAYLRSCTLEAETLRAEVKDALAELRTAVSTERMAAKAPTRRSWVGCLARVFSRRKRVN